MIRFIRLLLVVVPTVAFAQAPVPTDSLARQASAVMRTWPALIREDAERLLDSASRRGVPLAPLYTKVREGAAKMAAPDVIVGVVRQLEAALVSARDILGPASSEGELSAAAAAIQSGIAAPSLRSLQSTLKSPGSLTIALVVLTDLVRRGVEPVVATRALERLASAGATDLTFSQFRLDVVNDLSSGVAPQAAINRRADDYLSRNLLLPGGRRPPPP